MENGIIKYKNKEFIVEIDGEEKQTGENLVGMLMFYCKENKIELDESFEIEYSLFLKEYHELTHKKLKKGESWIINVKIPIQNPEINSLSKTIPGVFFDEDLAKQWANGYQKSNNIPGAIYTVEKVSLGYTFDQK